MPVLQEFSRFASTYDAHNTIQRQVATRVVSMVESCPARIADIGCGTGAVYGEIDWALEAFMALDFSEDMLEEHPSGPGVVKVKQDFDDDATFTCIEDFAPEYLVSASALQWSSDLATVFQRITDLNRPFALALFTSNTFRTLHKTAGIQSPIHSREAIVDAAQCFGACEIETAQYELTFENTREMLRYIKRSGVSGGKSRLTISQVRRLIKDYPRDCLEFEVVYIQRG